GHPVRAEGTDDPAAGAGGPDGGRAAAVARGTVQRDPDGSEAAGAEGELQGELREDPAAGGVGLRDGVAGEGGAAAGDDDSGCAGGVRRDCREAVPGTCRGGLPEGEDAEP